MHEADRHTSVSDSCADDRSHYPGVAFMISEQTKHVADASAITITVGALVDWLPAIAAGLSIVWTIIRIYETETVQGWLGVRKNGE